MCFQRRKHMTLVFITYKCPFIVKKKEFEKYEKKSVIYPYA